MANVTVYFATNRVPQGATTDWQSYRGDIIPPTDTSQIIYAEAFVEGTDLAVEGSGTLTAISHPQTGGFESGVAEDIVGSGKNILVFIRGFANSFLIRSPARATIAGGSPPQAQTPPTPQSSPSAGRLWVSIALYLIVSVNFIPRLGHEGPIHKTDAALYAPARFRMLDCTEVKDYDLWRPPDASHQYYRRSPKERADIVAAMCKDPNLPGV